MARMWCCAWRRAFGGRLGYPGPLMYNDIASGQPYSSSSGGTEVNSQVTGAGAAD